MQLLVIQISFSLGNYRKDSFEYATIKAKLHYQKYNRIKTENGKAITYYMMRLAYT
jgi:hypothetical protein